MKRAFGGVLFGILALFVMAHPVHADTDDFRFSSFEADYYLGSDSEARSTLKTVERLTAEFPNFDQNHGIERAIPKDYDGHSTSLKIISVADGAGKPLPYSTYETNGNLVLRIGDKDTYVRGTQQYLISYTQRDVTRVFGDTQRDEFYWDTNGTLWPQPFDRVVARVHVSDSLMSTYTSEMACYWGAEGSTKRCDSTRSGDTITAQANNLGPYENMTVALGFTLGTFRGYEPSLWDKIVGVWILSLIVTSAIGFGAIFWTSFRYSRASNRTKDMGSIAPEYIPPKDTNILLSAKIGDDTRADTTATLIDLAVRHYVTITQTKEKSLWHQAEYDLEIVKPVDTLSSEERDFIRTLFGGTTVGTKLETKTLKNNYTLSSKLIKNSQELDKRIKAGYGLRAKDSSASRPFRVAGLVMLVVGVLTLSPLLLIAALVAYICAWQLKPLTDKGLDLRRYLAGLKMYIEMAEKDRIKALQSPEAVGKTGVSIGGEKDKKLVHLYERTVPYAILFGQEKEWNKQLTVLYEENHSSPSWYAGHSAFNAAVFTSAMNDFSSSMNSYSASTSSSSGGSSGGGSSGGGGGGGGGGGW